MTIVVPVLHDRVSPVLDTATRFLLVEYQQGKETARREVPLSAPITETSLDSVGELHPDVLLCAAVSEPLLRALEAQGIQVEPHICGNVEEVLQAFWGGRLWQPDFRMPGCWGLKRGRGCCHRRRARRGHAAVDANLGQRLTKPA